MTLAVIEESMRGRPKSLGMLLPPLGDLITFVYSLLLHAFMSNPLQSNGRIWKSKPYCTGTIPEYWLRLVLF